jgi:hypothetical protein
MALIPPLVVKFGLDAIQLLICGIILIYLIRSRRQFQRRGETQTANTGAPGFQSEVVLQVVRQQAERTFETVLETLRHERRLFDQFLDQYPWGAHSCGRRLVDAAGPGDPSVESDAEDASTSREADTREVDRLSREGLGPAQIAERMRIPLEEVQLRLRLSNYSAKADANRRMTHR